MKIKSWLSIIGRIIIYLPILVVIFLIWRIITANKGSGIIDKAIRLAIKINFEKVGDLLDKIKGLKKEHNGIDDKYSKPIKTISFFLLIFISPCLVFGGQYVVFENGKYRDYKSITNYAMALKERNYNLEQQNLYYDRMAESITNIIELELVKRELERGPTAIEKVWKEIKVLTVFIIGALIGSNIKK